MRRDRRDGGGDQYRGVGAPHVITARTVETARPDSTGDPHSTTNPSRISLDPLWPLVIVLGDVALRVAASRGASALTVPESTTNVKCRRAEPPAGDIYEE